VAEVGDAAEVATRGRAGKISKHSKGNRWQDSLFKDALQTTADEGMGLASWQALQAHEGQQVAMGALCPRRREEDQAAFEAPAVQGELQVFFAPLPAEENEDMVSEQSEYSPVPSIGRSLMRGDFLRRLNGGATYSHEFD